MLRMFVISSSLFFLSATPSLAANLAPGCNVAVQNWQNGSQTTCVYDSNAGLLVVNPAPPTPVMREKECHGYKGEYGRRGEES
jgi:hypothetical protein